ncbi:uncharacterized protein LOC127833072 [Dreissena polymorpha]|uniref:C2H2-type domain-containing protein n=1 Tax=Dreissena polymorpha TaxID=45954 RepID=A0A9D4MT98_DREPO|nr:uncharacterized protein LOC127833072 [Dreissena polymorpha]KAH3882950.1 hypothetical protein DPMN_006897 [Dreissena polymorpha]
MSKKDSKFYVCLHETCHFRTDKRKAIYTHLIRTHSERKEDYECEYCSATYEREDLMEEHLHRKHPREPFTYTCVSRIENVINTCAELGSRPNTAVQITSSSAVAAAADKENHVKHDAARSDMYFRPVVTRNSSHVRTKASVNESLTEIAKFVKAEKSESLTGDSEDESMSEGEDSGHDMDTGGAMSGDGTDEDGVELDSESESQTYTSEPSGLKIKFSLKKNSNSTMGTSRKRDVSESPPILLPHMVASPVVTSGQMTSPPDIVGNGQSVIANAQVRDKASKYYDKLEVYHITDSKGRRCCPFCDYKTTKNTIRVHLSGIHKIYFVKCSLCDYRAAFPHQIIQHGIKFHKTTNLNVIQLSKESRERVIAKLKQTLPIDSQACHADDVSAGDIDMDATIDDEDFNSEESQTNSSNSDEEENENEAVISAADDRVFKAPVCQTSKTDYYSIHYENGVYLYSCNLCPFQTPVRATIYTHKYRHEEKSYMCGYCDFTSAPRSNVVHHIRGKHKGKAILVRDADDQIGTRANENPVHENPDGTYADDSPDQTKTVEEMPPADNEITDDDDKPVQPIIKVPQFKRSILLNELTSESEPKKIKLEESESPVSYKLSLNKLYRINPSGSPKFLCVMCSYACDTHPKMKHHLYRHRPQKYKCPYCDHRKYPRSYVVRHVRDTHRNKPVRVIDLSKGNEPEDVPEYAQENAELDEEEERLAELVSKESDASSPIIEKTSVNNFVDTSDEPNEEVDALKKFAQKLNLKSVLTSNLGDDLFPASADDSANFDETDFTSTPLIESMINGKFKTGIQSFAKTTNTFEKKKSTRDYRVSCKGGPRYVCNKCGYGTENYKTIHNHMYRHESQRYQCPYCGYRRSPRSFVETHIREVHKGQPVIITELDALDEIDPPDNSAEVPNPNSDALTMTPLLSGFPAHKSEINRNLTSPTQVKIEPVSAMHSEKAAELQQTTVSISNSTLQTTIASPGQSSENNQMKFKKETRTTFKTMYKCTFDPETCNHISKDKSKMKQHLFMHVEYKPWSCDFCEMTASQSSHIKNHVRSEHPAVSETSFKYKKHNYLEKHIESFLTKGLFTVPVNEYRVIMDMKGNTKSSKNQTIFSRDASGNLECPYCSYKTKTGNMTDHVKMKHMQPRFKCHWCDYSAFYRSEVRKHHRKEKSHRGREFKIQELDLVQVVEGFKEKNGLGIDASVHATIQNMLGEEEDDDDDDEDDAEKDEADDDDSASESLSDSSSFGDSSQGYMEYTTEQLSELCTAKQRPIGGSNNGGTTAVAKQSNTTTGNGTSKSEHTVDGRKRVVMTKKCANTPTSSKFKCGYCSFSAALRVKVKMHCSKKHSDRKLNVIDPPSKNDVCLANNNKSNLRVGSNIVNISSDDIKGTKFEQDLRNAGVSKLNLASLFPNSKRFRMSQNNKDRRMNMEKAVEPVQNIKEPFNSFKKPLNPTLTPLSSVANNTNISVKIEHNDETTPVNNLNETVVKLVNGTKTDTTTRNTILKYPNCFPVIVDDAKETNDVDFVEDTSEVKEDEHNDKSSPMVQNEVTYDDMMKRSLSEDIDQNA